MFGRKTVFAKMKMLNSYAINVVMDWFGVNARISKKDDEVFAEIETNEDALIYWALQYGESVELVSPLETREKIKEKIKNINNQYNN